MQRFAQLRLTLLILQVIWYCTVVLYYYYDRINSRVYCLTDLKVSLIYGINKFGKCLRIKGLECHEGKSLA